MIKKRPAPHFILITSTMIILFSLFYFYNKNAECKRLDCLTMNNLAKFRVKEIYEDSDSNYSALLGYDNYLLRIGVQSNLEPQEAENNINARVFRMKSLFTDAPAPYPGVISDKIVCDKAFVPEFKKEKINSIWFSYFTGYLTPRLTFGACTEDQVYYKGILAFFYCPSQKKLYQLEIIAPKEDYNTNPQRYTNMLHSISCRE